MLIRCLGDDSASGGALDEAAAEQERFDVVFECVGGDAHAVGHGAYSRAGVAVQRLSTRCGSTDDKTVTAIRLCRLL